MSTFVSPSSEPVPYFHRPTVLATFSPNPSSDTNDNDYCNTIYNKVILQSYALVILNVVLFSILKFLAEEYIFPLILNLFGFNKKDSTTLQQSTTTINPITGIQNFELESGQRNTSNSLTKISAITNSKIAFLYFQFCAAVLSVTVAFRNIDHNKSTWQQYNDFYGLLLNSSALTYIISVIPVLTIANKEERLFSFLGGTASIMCLLCMYPPLFTHIVPGMFAYVWVEATFIFLLVSFFILLNMLLQYVSSGYIQIFSAFHDNEGANDFSIKLSRVLIDMGYRLVAILICQTFYNYMYLLYNTSNSSSTTDNVISGHAYIQVIVDEYQLRSQTVCLLHNIFDTFENMTVFFNWL